MSDLHAMKCKIYDKSNISTDEWGETLLMIAEANTPEIASHIVKCVNSHDVLLKALEYALDSARFAQNALCGHPGWEEKAANREFAEKILLEAKK